MDCELKVGKLYRVCKPGGTMDIHTTIGMEGKPTKDWKSNSQLNHGAVVMYVGVRMSDPNPHPDRFWHQLLCTDGQVHYIFHAFEDEMHEALIEVTAGERNG